MLVVNAPTSNIVSAAEHAVALLLAAARQIPAADASLREGAWKRSTFTGVEICGKTVGIVGLGRIGVSWWPSGWPRSAPRWSPTTPTSSPAAPPSSASTWCRWRSCSRESDFISVHLPKTPETVGPDRRGGAGQRPSRASSSSTPPAAGWSTRQALAEARRRGQVGGGGHRRVRHRAVHRQPAVRAADRSSSPRTWGRRPTEAQDKAGTGGRPLACGWRCRASSCPTRSTCGRRRRRPRRCARGLPLVREARPGVHRRRRRPGPVGRASRCAASSPSSTSRCCSSPSCEGVFSDVVEEQVTYVNAPAARRAARPRGRRCPATSRAPTTATWSPCAARWPTAPR